MEQVFITNPKGGCGKTTVSTQLAAYYAVLGKKVLLIDHDAQKSSTDWLARRPDCCAKIESVAVSVDTPVDFKDAEVVVHDMPAAWSVEHVSEIIHPGDKVLIPVLSSPNDIKACLRFVMSLNRSGVLDAGIQAGFIGNRVRSQTSYRKVLNEFLIRLNLPLITTLRDTQNYVRLMDQGKSIFDSPNSKVKDDLVQWEPVISWLSESVSLNPPELCEVS